MVFDWYYSPPGIEVASAREPLYHMFLELLCTQYNKIALQYERENMPDKAEDIYRNILRNFDWTKGCFKEAEIGLQNLRSKAAK